MGREHCRRVTLLEIMEPMNLNMRKLFLLLKQHILGSRRGVRNSSRNRRDNKKAEVIAQLSKMNES